MTAATTAAAAPVSVGERERVRHRLDGQPERGQRDPVVDQALALKDGDDARRRPQPGHHRRGRHGVGGCHRGGERQRGRPAEARQDEVGHPAHPTIVAVVAPIASAVIGTAFSLVSLGAERNAAL